MVIGWLKERAVSLLEQHPYGYVLGLAIMESTSLLLPHESDFYGMPLLTSQRSGLFLDVGANRGHSSLGFKKVMPGWQTLAIEANPLHEPRLAALKRRHAFFDYRIAAADAVSGRSVTIWTPRYGGFDCHSAAALTREDAVRGILASFPDLEPNFRYEERLTRTLALDDLGIAPDIVKIDVQGKELDTIRGLEATIAKCRPSLLIECNLDDGTIASEMASLGYIAYIYERANHSLTTAAAIERPPSRNMFFLPKERAAGGRR